MYIDTHAETKYNPFLLPISNNKNCMGKNKGTNKRNPLWKKIRYRLQETVGMQLSKKA